MGKLKNNKDLFDKNFFNFTIINKQEVFMILLFVLINTDFTYILKCSEPEIISENGYVKLSLTDYNYLRIPGKPEMPFKPIVFLLPPDAIFKTISFELLDSTIIDLHNLIFPAQRYIPFFKDSKVERVEPDKNVYSSNEPYPGILIKSFGESRKGVFRLLTINIYPIQYIPALNRLIIYDIKLRIEYENSDKFVKINRNQFEFHKKGVEKLVINPEMIDYYRR